MPSADSAELSSVSAWADLDSRWIARPRTTVRRRPNIHKGLTKHISISNGAAISAQDTRGNRAMSGGRAGDLAAVRGAHDMDARAGALLGRVDHVQAKSLGHLGGRSGLRQQGTVAVLDVGEAVDIELEHLGGVLHAQTVTGAQVLIDPDTKRLTQGLRDPLLSVGRRNASGGPSQPSVDPATIRPPV
jgi:hypothetical protein